MFRVPVRSLALGLSLLGLSSGCGSDDPGAEDAGGRAGASGNELPLLPWRVGNTWTYRVTDPSSGISTEKIQTILEEEPVGGAGPNKDLRAHRVVTRKGDDGTDETISWQGKVGSSIVRYRERAFGAKTAMLELEEHWSPHKLRVTSAVDRTADEATWLETYQETKLPVGAAPTTAQVNDRWIVLGVNETVEVPAGTFTNAIHLQKVGGSSQKQYWYVPEVGKVKETGGQTEELVDYQVSP